jgi:hypothetical protein
MPDLPLLKFSIDYEGQRYRLVHSPIGWNESEFKESVVESYFVLRREFSTSLKFVVEGKELLRKIVYAKSIEALADIYIEKLNYETWQYEDLFLGQFDFSKFIEDKDGFSVNAMEGGLSANIKAFDNVVYEIPLDSTNNALPLNIGGIGVSQFANFTGGISQVAPVDTLNNFAPGLTVEEETVDDDFMLLNDTEPQSGQAGVDEFEPFLQTTRALRCRIQIKFDYSTGYPNNVGEFTYYLQFYIKAVFGDILYGKTIYPLSGLNHCEIDVTLDLPDNTFLTFFVFNPAANGGDWMLVTFYDLTFKIEYSAYTDEYTAQAISAFDLYKALVKKMNPLIGVTATSNVLSSEPWNRLMITSGDGIRGIQGAVIKTTFKKFFEAMNAEFCAGFDTVGNKAILENRRFFYNPYAMVVEIGEVLDMKIEPDISYSYTSLKVGYEDQTYDKTEGKDEFNTEVEFIANDQKRVQTKKEILSPYRADPRGVDQLLIDFRADPTRDNKGDSEVFMFMRQAESVDGKYPLEGVEKYADVQGTSALGRIYNLFLTPWRMMQRHSCILSVPYAVKQEGELMFSSSKKNANLQTTDLLGNVIREKDPLTYDKMETPLFLPFLATVSSSMSDVMYDKIRRDRTYGYIKYSYMGKIYKGFRIESGFDIVEKSTKELKLRFTSDTNLL